MPFEKVNDLQLYYEVHGEGEVILLLHHGFGSTKMWKDTYPQFVARGFKVVTYDRRGYGRSEGGTIFRIFTKTNVTGRKASMSSGHSKKSSASGSAI